MTDPKEETTLRRHAKFYLQTVRRLKDANLSDYVAHQQAERAADREFKLTLEERRQRDAWLDEKFPGRKKKPQEHEGAPTLWDDLPTAR